MSTFEAPRVVVFGTGLDSPLLCRAATDLHEGGRILFVEGERDWAEEARAELRLISDRCDVQHVHYDTVLDEWMDLIGRQHLLADRVISQLEGGTDLVGRVDVVFVDGPSASRAGQPGRMMSMSAAAHMVRDDGLGAVFVDDYDRPVERIWASYLFRPLFGTEWAVPGWVPRDTTVFFTRNELFGRALTEARARAQAPGSRGAADGSDAAVPASRPTSWET